MAGELQQRRLGGAIMKGALAFRRVIEPGVGRDLAIHGGDVDDAGFARRRHGRFERRQRGAHRLESGGDAAGIGLRRNPPASARQKASPVMRHGIVDQDVEPLEAAEESPQAPRHRRHRKRRARPRNPRPAVPASKAASVASSRPLTITWAPASASARVMARPRWPRAAGNESDAAIEPEKLLGIHGTSHAAGAALPARFHVRSYASLTLHGKQAIYAAVQHLCCNAANLWPRAHLETERRPH